MNTVPVVFLPVSACQSHPAAGQMQGGLCVPHAASFWSAGVPLGVILAILAGVTVFDIAGSWLLDRYEHRGLKVTRRWYSKSSRIRLRFGAAASLYVVLAWIESETPVPWLEVHKLNPENPAYWDEDAEAFWAPVTDFAPYSVRRIRPHLWRYGWLRVPVLFRQVLVKAETLPKAAVIPGVRGRRLELMRVASTGQWALFRNLIRLGCTANADMDPAAAMNWASATLGRAVEWENATDAPDERCGYWVAASEAGAR